MKNSAFQRIWLPGFLFMGVLIGGGYATGRELVEYFLTSGPIGGYLGMLLATVGFSIITALSFELARMTQSYSYRSFFQKLLGRGWFLFEIGYFILGLLVLAVIGSAAGEIVADHLGISSTVGTVGLMVLIGLLVFYGTSIVEKVLGGWSIVLYGTYALFVAWYMTEYKADFVANISADTLNPDWAVGGIKYIGYSIAVIPIIMFCTKHMQSRKDALLAGALAGPIAMIPAALFFMAMVASYPDVLGASVPADYMMQRLDVPFMKVLFYIAVFGTFVQTGTGFVHAANERIAEVYHERSKEMPRWMRPVVAVVALGLSITLANQFGLVGLIAQGYGTLAWGFIVIYLVPLLTYGVWQIFVKKRQSASDHAEAA